MHLPAYHWTFSNMLKGKRQREKGHLRQWHTFQARPLWSICKSIYPMPLTNTLGTKVGTNTMIYPMTLHKPEYSMLNFSSTFLVCMQRRHHDCRQHSYALRLRDCDQNFFREPLGILAGKPLGCPYRYWLRF